MRKIKTMRAASALLVAVLLTTCTISGTFAKYVTSDSGTDTARVAKWGVTVDAEGVSDAFAKEYGDTVKAESTSTLDVVAPGTNGLLGAITLKGTPEVAVAVTYDSDLKLENWKVGSVEYCPIIITVDGVTYGVTGMKDSSGVEATNKYSTVAALVAAVNDAIDNRAAQTYGPNTDLSTVTGHGLKVSWEWAYDKNDDAKDTALGDNAAGENHAIIQFNVEATVTQID